jgi:hypothetical protein
VAKVIRLEPGGYSAVEEVGLSIEHAKGLAARLAEAGEPPGCCWCVGVEEEKDENDPPRWAGHRMAGGM